MWKNLFSRKQERVEIPPAPTHVVTATEQPDFISWCDQMKVSLLAPKNQPTFVRVGDKIRVVDLHNL